MLLISSLFLGHIIYCEMRKLTDKIHSCFILWHSDNPILWKIGIDSKMMTETYGILS